MSTTKDIGVEKIGHVGLIEIRRPPLNFFDIRSEERRVGKEC